VSPPSGYKSLASLMRFRPLTIGKIQIVDPRPEIMVRQLFAAPMALVGAAGIIYFALPETGNPGFLVVLGTFLFSFSAVETVFSEPVSAHRRQNFPANRDIIREFHQKGPRRRAQQRISR
jgi:hypothetical protein